MADVKFARSPIIMGHTLFASYPNGSASCEVRIDGTLRYSLFRNGFGNNNKSTYFEVGDLIKDYIEVEFNGSPQSYEVSVTLDLEMYNQPNGGGTTIYTRTDTFLATAGYSYFEEGELTISDGRKATSQEKLYIPEGQSSTIPKFFSTSTTTAFSYTSISTTATSIVIDGNTIPIERICTPKYTPFEMYFINRFGALDRVWFELVRKDTTSVQSKDFKRYSTNADGSLNTYKHNKQKFHINGKDTFTLNSGYRDESFNFVMDEILLSEYVWVYYSGRQDGQANWRPVNVVTSSLEKKTHINDKLIQYELQLEEAYDKVYNVR